MERKNTQLDFSGQAIYVGIDLHSKQWKITTATRELMHKSFSQPANSLTLYKYLKRTYPRGTYYTVYEAGCFGFWAHRELERYGIHSVVVNPADVPVTDKEKKPKEDKRDSRKLAKALRGGELEAIHIPMRETEEDRNLMRVRTMFSKDLTRYKNRIKSMFLYYGIAIPERFSESSTHWSRNFMDWVYSVKLHEESGNTALTKIIEHCEYIRKELLAINREIRKLSRTQRYKEDYTNLISIPGIGTITSMVLLTELEDVSRFKNLDRLASYVGLVPRTNSSGEQDKTGSITTRRNNHIRSLLIESAWIAARTDPALSLKFNELCKRMKRNKAIVIIAKKLLNRVRFVLLNKQPYVQGIVK